MFKKVILFLIGLSSLLYHAQILSIDYGTQFVKAALVHTGAGKTFSIVENPKSQRKFINAVIVRLLRWESITRNASTRLTLSPSGHEDHRTASFSRDYSSICTITRVIWNRSRRTSFWNISSIRRAINFWPNSSCPNCLRTPIQSVSSKQWP